MAKVQKMISKNFRRIILFLAVVFAVVIFAFVAGMNLKTNADSRAILEESIKSQLVSISLAAREVLDVDAFAGYNSEADVEADADNYAETLSQLRGLANSVGAEYIYALKKIDGEYYFVFDTDTEDEEIFIPYDLAPVHAMAFAGENSADTLNVVDEWGSYNTGAVPIIKDDEVIGIISVDLEDDYLIRNNREETINAVILIVTLLAALVVMIIVVTRLLKKVSDMQTRLQRMAHFDNVTGLPNRQYLLDYLGGITSGEDTSPFALLFIDLDNFKSVNDNAGHDAGDELLRAIAGYLEKALDNAMSFRPAPGILNIAARIGGDEFVQIVSGVETREQAEHVAQHLLSGFQEQGEQIDRYIEKYKVGLSIGIALFPYHTKNYHVLIKYADIAMYHAKHAGKNSFRVYEDEMHAKEES